MQSEKVVKTSREIALFALRWDVRYWWGQYRIPGVDHEAICDEIGKLRRKIERLEGLR